MSLSEEQFQKLSSGVPLLKQAISKLVITPAEDEVIRKVLARNETLLSSEKVERKARKQESERQAKLKREKREQEIKAMHTKSGFSTYVVRLPGSYGSSKS